MSDKVICPYCKKDLSSAASIIGLTNTLEMHSHAHQWRDLCDTLKRIRKGIDKWALRPKVKKELDNLISAFDY